MYRDSEGQFCLQFLKELGWSREPSWTAWNLGWGEWSLVSASLTGTSQKTLPIHTALPR